MNRPKVLNMGHGRGVYSSSSFVRDWNLAIFFMQLTGSLSEQSAVVVFGYNSGSQSVRYATLIKHSLTVSGTNQYSSPAVRNRCPSLHAADCIQAQTSAPESQLITLCDYVQSAAFGCAISICRADSGRC